ncbi:MAG: phosphotransferase [Wenzhouxiangellaceae bacterium]
MTSAHSEFDERGQLLAQWLGAHFNHHDWQMTPASADASFRRYFRVTQGGQPWIAMDAPPANEDVWPWLAIARRLREAGVNAPQVHAADTGQGFVLMQDFGDRWLLDALTEATADTLYQQAMTALWRMQQAVPHTDLPVYDESRLRQELDLFPEWFLQRHLGLELSAAQQQQLEQLFELLVTQALAQPRVFVHRDYHSRNLLLTGSAELGIIDFQDAVSGPLTYDLVSLLKDCYVRWPVERVRGWLAEYHHRCASAGLCTGDRHTFQRWFDLMGLQRHLKVLGIFCRLYYRDGKAGYLNDLPRVLEYVVECCQRYGATQPLGRWLSEVTAAVDIRQPRQSSGPDQ